MRKTIQWTALLLAFSIMTMSCSSTTMIRSTPDSAKLYLNGEPVGTTPYTLTDKKIVGSVNHIRLEKEGYETFETTFSKNEEVNIGAIVGGLFLLFPFLWTMKYKPTHTYEMAPENQASGTSYTH